jgi:hypothetical protein
MLFKVHRGDGRERGPLLAGSSRLLYDSRKKDLVGAELHAIPRISQFYGIAVYMYYRDHAPPHFHAIHAEYEAEVDIATEGTL